MIIVINLFHNNVRIHINLYHINSFQLLSNCYRITQLCVNSLCLLMNYPEVFIIKYSIILTDNCYKWSVINDFIKFYNEWYMYKYNVSFFIHVHVIRFFKLIYKNRAHNTQANTVTCS